MVEKKLRCAEVLGFLPIGLGGVALVAEFRDVIFVDYLNSN